MKQEIIQTNKTKIEGEIMSDFQFSHEVYGEAFYLIEVAVNRLSNRRDIIPVMVSEHMVDTKQSYIGQYIRAVGQFRSYRLKEENRKRLILFIFIQKLEFLDKVSDGKSNNDIFLDGYICKTPIYRMTPFKREITELLLTVKRSYGKSDYIPCICWGSQARMASVFKVGEHVCFKGRIQSREYVKIIAPDESEYHIAYEVSVRDFCVKHP